VSPGSRTLKDALNEALRDWVPTSTTPSTLSARSRARIPIPLWCVTSMSVIGRERAAQCLEREGRLPDALVACVGGGSNAIGLFYPFIDDDEVAMYGVEAAATAVETGRHAAPLIVPAAAACCTATAPT
jgi:tryptophan synthase beta chain